MKLPAVKKASAVSDRYTSAETRKERNVLLNTISSFQTGGGLAVGTVLLIGETEHQHFNSYGIILTQK